MRLLLAIISLSSLAHAQASKQLRVEGEVRPAGRSSVTLHGAVTPFNSTVLTSTGGRFSFKNVDQGTYTIEAFQPGLGSLRRTIEVGPTTADDKGVVRVILPLDDARVRKDRSSLVTLSQLSVPDKAKNLYISAMKKLSKRDVDGAVQDLEQAVEISPIYADAWNHLGTIRYQTKRYPEAEQCFRRALEADLNAYAPLVNLGGVLLNLARPEEALRYNQYAVLREPTDALAHSQLGMTYYLLGRWTLAERELKEAIRLDAAHFSHPQLLLGEMYLQLHRPDDAAAQFEEFLKLHPDDPRAADIRRNVKSIKERI